VILIRCDEERFDFLSEEFGDKVEFRDQSAPKIAEDLFHALVQMEIPRQFDYVLSCDIDEYLILHGRTIEEFIENNPHDSHFFWWGICCSVGQTTNDLRDNLKLGVGLGHDGKSLFNVSKALCFLNEHRVILKPNCEVCFQSDSLSSPYLLHFSSRSMEDLLLRSMLQSIKVEISKRRHHRCLTAPPEKFEDLPLRFKIAYFQTKIKKQEVALDLPPLSVDVSALQSQFSELNMTPNSSIFEKDYDIKKLLEGYPEAWYERQEDFQMIVNDERTVLDKLII
jgi:hypothetical protein